MVAREAGRFDEGDILHGGAATTGSHQYKCNLASDYGWAATEHEFIATPTVVPFLSFGEESTAAWSGLSAIF